jgi:hypothetical protein
MVIMRVQLKPSALRQANGTNLLEALQRRQRDAILAAATTTELKTENDD